MKLKRAVLAELSREELKEIVDQLEMDGVDRRSAEAMREALRRSRRAAPALLLEYLGESQVKTVCDAIGVDARGRRRQLIERLLAKGDDGRLRAKGGNGRGAKPVPSPKSEGNRPIMARNKPAAAAGPSAENYQHPESKVLLRPDVGTQAQFRKKKPPQKYRYDSSLSPALDWDSQNSARELGEWLLALIEEAASLPAPHAFDAPRQWPAAGVEIRNLQEAVEQLKRISRPFLNWTGKAERLSFDVPTLPLFVHERLSTKAIIETLVGHKRATHSQLELFGDPEHSIADQVLKPYEYEDQWTNRMILGDSLAVMNSLLHYERLGGQVQMIYMDPPYGVRFGSNFQPFVRKRDVKHGDDEDMTREPETVQAYRDTWELGLHSYLTYLRDRLLLCRELLAPSGSIFVQISDENLHHVREVMDEVFGRENMISTISVRKTGGATSDTLPTVVDYLIWYARDCERIKYRAVFAPKTLGEEGATEYTNVEEPDGTIRRITEDEASGRSELPRGARIFATDSAVSEGFRTNTSVPFTWRGIKFDPGRTKNWKTSIEGMLRLCELGRILPRPGFRIC
ncbi:MAG TPA: DNA methyltransferase [Pirellulales bacterium]|nr:DNA methyltransferase [Pirellulales bacterium]